MAHGIVGMFSPKLNFGSNPVNSLQLLFGSLVVESNVNIAFRRAKRDCQLFFDAPTCTSFLITLQMGSVPILVPHLFYFSQIKRSGKIIIRNVEPCRVGISRSSDFPKCFPSDGRFPFERFAAFARKTYQNPFLIKPVMVNYNSAKGKARFILL